MLNLCCKSRRASPRPATLRSPQCINEILSKHDVAKGGFKVQGLDATKPSGVTILVRGISYWCSIGGMGAARTAMHTCRPFSEKPRFHTGLHMLIRMRACGVCAVMSPAWLYAYQSSCGGV